jgi:hypothetical protein
MMVLRDTKVIAKRMKPVPNSALVARLDRQQASTVDVAAGRNNGSAVDKCLQAAETGRQAQRQS